MGSVWGTGITKPVLWLVFGIFGKRYCLCASQFCEYLWSWIPWACETGKKLYHRLGSPHLEGPVQKWTVGKALSIFGWNCSFLTLLEFLHHCSSLKKPSSPPSLHLQPSNIYITLVSWSLFVFHVCIYFGQSLSNSSISVIFCSVWSWLQGKLYPQKVCCDQVKHNMPKTQHLNVLVAKEVN